MDARDHVRKLDKLVAEEKHLSESHGVPVPRNKSV